jgi:hypothetical protein
MSIYVDHHVIELKISIADEDPNTGSHLRNVSTRMARIIETALQLATKKL